jgi:hypothetical protein
VPPSSVRWTCVCSTGCARACPTGVRRWRRCGLTASSTAAHAELGQEPWWSPSRGGAHTQMKEMQPTTTSIGWSARSRGDRVHHRGGPARSSPDGPPVSSGDDDDPEVAGTELTQPR